jgi:UDP-N-acetylglucosamine:LPS N-acetylglucosamine transferase
VLARKIGRLAAEPERIREMGRASHRLARPHAAEAIGDIAERLLTGDREGGDDVP